MFTHRYSLLTLYNLESRWMQCDKHQFNPCRLLADEKIYTFSFGVSFLLFDFKISVHLLLFSFFEGLTFHSQWAANKRKTARAFFILWRWFSFSVCFLFMFYHFKVHRLSSNTMVSGCGLRVFFFSFIIRIYKCKY